MEHSSINFFVFIFILLFLIGSRSPEELKLEEIKHKVTMRQIGHEVLKCLGDDTSRVLPIEKNENHYKISFENDLGFDPDDIIWTIDRIVKETQMSSHYFVEIEQCDTKQLVHSFEMSPTISADQIACTGRVLPLDCYSLLITMVDHLHTNADPAAPDSHNKKSLGLLSLAFAILSLVIFGIYIKYKKRNSISEALSPETGSELLLIGSSYFDQHNRVLSFNGSKTELSHKETELLILLHQHKNTTVKRDEILQKVWGDTGNYIGRTLDVFISKLRKKLEPDSRLKIVNIRGVGYKLVNTL